VGNGGHPRGDQGPGLKRRGQAHGEPRRHVVHVLLPLRRLFGFFGPLIRRRCRIAIMTRTVPIAIFTASDASDGTVFGLGGLLPVATSVIVTTMAREPSQP